MHPRKKINPLMIADEEPIFNNNEKKDGLATLICSTTTSIAESKDEEYTRHLAAIIESSDDAIISKSMEGIIKSWNKGSEKMFGFTAEQAVGKHISIIIPREYISEEKRIERTLTLITQGLPADEAGNISQPIRENFVLTAQTA